MGHLNVGSMEPNPGQKLCSFEKHVNLKVNVLLLIIKKYNNVIFILNTLLTPVLAAFSDGPRPPLPASAAE